MDIDERPVRFGQELRERIVGPRQVTPEAIQPLFHPRGRFLGLGEPVEFARARPDMVRLRLVLPGLDPLAGHPAAGRLRRLPEGLLEENPVQFPDVGFGEGLVGGGEVANEFDRDIVRLHLLVVAQGM